MPRRHKKLAHFFFLKRSAYLAVFMGRVVVAMVMSIAIAVAVTTIAVMTVAVPLSVALITIEIGAILTGGRRGRSWWCWR